MDSTGTAKIYDLTSWRLKKVSAQRLRSGERRQFLWAWPATGQVVTVDFPLSTAKPFPDAARLR